MEKQVSDFIHSLPTDPQQDYPHMDMNFIDSLLPKSKKKNTPVKKKVESDSESDSDDESGSDSDDSDDEEGKDKIVTQRSNKNVWNELKATFLASIVFVILNLDIIDLGLRNMGLTGVKSMLVKLFLFATIYFVIRYKFM
jgi:hypothetical protein